jgi:hypothetical protein
MTTSVFSVSNKKGANKFCLLAPLPDDSLAYNVVNEGFKTVVERRPDLH